MRRKASKDDTIHHLHNHRKEKSNNSFRKISTRGYIIFLRYTKWIVLFFVLVILIFFIQLAWNRNVIMIRKKDLKKSYIGVLGDGKSCRDCNSSRNVAKTLAGLMDEATASFLLIKDGEKDMLRGKSNKEFKFFVYDNLPNEYTWESISKCIRDKYKGGSNCDWGASVCIEDKHSSSPYTSRRFNTNGDVVLSKIFSEYDGPLRTYDPNKASLFIVPYPHAGHCECKVTRGNCRGKLPDRELNRLFKNLNHLNDLTKERHLFLYSDCNPGHPLIMRSPLLVTTNPTKSKQCKNTEGKCGHIAIPYVNTDPNYQPDRIKALDEDWWITRPRKFSLFAMMGTNVAGASIRNEFVNEADSLFGSEIGGLPVNINDIFKRRFIPKPRQLMEMYRDSVFCPCLRGDTPDQKRFFDVIMSGCIPVVMKYESNEDGYPSYFAPKSASIRKAYPFAKGSFHGNSNMGIDYESMVVAVNGTCGLPCMKPTLEAVMENQTGLYRLRRNLMKAARFFSYGMEDNALKHVDAVSAILVSIRHFLEN